MKKLTISTLLVCALSFFAHASIEQGITAFENGNLALAKKIFSQESDTRYQKHLYLALISSENNKLDDAEEYINEAIELNANNANVQFSYAEIMAKQAEAASVFSLLSYIKKVKKAFTAAVNLAPENIEYRSALIQFHINAPSMLGGDINEALRHAQDLKKLNALLGTSAELQVYGAMKDKQEFDDILNTALLEFGDEPELFYQLGLYHQKQEDYEQALFYLRKASNMPASTDKQRNAKYSAVFQIARTSILSGNNFDEGKKAITQYLNEAVISSSMPSTDWAKFRLANIVEAQGEKLKAIQLYKGLAQDSAEIELQKQVKQRIKKLS